MAETSIGKGYTVRYRFLKTAFSAVLTTLEPCQSTHSALSLERGRATMRGVLKVERHNLSVRMTNRRFTRPTNAFSKTIENHAAAVALGYFAYNFIKIHRTLRITLAMAAGVTNRLWEVSDLVALWEAKELEAQRAA